MDLKKYYSGCKPGTLGSYLKCCYSFSKHGEYRFATFRDVRAIHLKIQGKRTKILESSHGDASS
jgi:hypothetical protein